VLDAKGQRLGHLAGLIAAKLQGKDKPDFSRHLLTGDFVVVVNAAQIEVSGNKAGQKLYRRHSGYIGHLRTTTFAQLMVKDPRRVVEHAVKGMLPKNILGRKMLRRLKVYSGPDHLHEAQVRAGQGRGQRSSNGATTPPANPPAPRASSQGANAP